MKASINRSGCIGCTLCAAICPDVFFMADDGKADVSQTRPKCPISMSRIGYRH